MVLCGGVAPAKLKQAEEERDQARRAAEESIREIAQQKQETARTQRELEKIQNEIDKYKEEADAARAKVDKFADEARKAKNSAADMKDEKENHASQLNKQIDKLMEEKKQLAGDNKVDDLAFATFAQQADEIVGCGGMMLNLARLLVRAQINLLLFCSE